jgi:hypothetical protein
MPAALAGVPADERARWFVALVTLDPAAARGQGVLDKAAL